MASGLLSGRMSEERVSKMDDGDWRKKSPDFQGDRLKRNLQLATLLTEIGVPHNVPAGVFFFYVTVHN